MLQRQGERHRSRPRGGDKLHPRQPHLVGSSRSSTGGSQGAHGSEACVRDIITAGGDPQCTRAEEVSLGRGRPRHDCISGWSDPEGEEVSGL